MAGFLEVEVSGTKELGLMFDRLSEVTNPENVLDAAGAILLNRVRTRFLDQEDPDGNRWPESQAAIKRRAIGRGGGTLFDTGALFHSIQLSTGGPGVRKISTDKPYAADHQRGLHGQEERVFLGFSNEDTRVVKTLIVAMIERAQRG